jgi:nicotinamide-nucleotide amidase
MSNNISHDDVHNKLNNLTKITAEALFASANVLVTAESCTGGWVAKLMTDISGSSAWFDRGFVTYTNQSKQELLQVSAESLARYGAVSEQVVKEMTAGALVNSPATFALAISGIAGPSGGTQEKPVGMVCFSWQVLGGSSEEETLLFTGDRHAIRAQAVYYALEKIIRIIK